MGPIVERCPVEFRLLGTFEVTAGGRTLEIGSAKQRALLAMLVLQLNWVVSFDAIVEELWGERPPPSASAGVQVLVSRLRGSLSEAAPGSGGALRAKEPGYLLEADPAAVDAARFEALAASGRDALSGGNPERAARELREALGLWRGGALADLSERPFARIEAARLGEARLVTVEELAEAELALGRPLDAAARLEAHVSDQPLREGARGSSCSPSTARGARPRPCGPTSSSVAPWPKSWAWSPPRPFAPWRPGYSPMLPTSRRTGEPGGGRC